MGVEVEQAFGARHRDPIAHRFAIILALGLQPIWLEQAIGRRVKGDAVELGGNLQVDDGQWSIREQAFI